MTEAQLQAAVIELAGLLGFMAAHFRPAQVGGRWVTAMAGNPGFPDCVFAKAGRVILAELKAAGRSPTGEQRRWLEALGGETSVSAWDEGEGGVDVYVWRPSDWTSGRIERVLRGEELP
jgi:hypothetical protein